MFSNILYVLLAFVAVGINCCDIEVRLANSIPGESKVQVQVPGAKFDQSVEFSGPATKSVQVNAPNCNAEQWKITSFNSAQKAVSELKTIFDGNGYVRIMVEANRMWVNDRSGITCSQGQCA
uniref:ZP domain-containing protein n=1 Tax=Rhabditophanes sp. KR3021 TaxID=114890 RepID=A0AC35U4Y4_9BILA